MESASNLADSGLSSTATLAPTPLSSFTKSILTAYSQGALNGWSYETFAFLSGNQPSLPLALPSISAFSHIIVHMYVSPFF